MKKAFSLLLALCLIAGMTACDGGNNGNTSTTESTTTTTAASSVPSSTEGTTTTDVPTSTEASTTTTANPTVEASTTTKTTTTVKPTTEKPTTTKTTTTMQSTTTTTKHNYPSVALTADNWQTYFTLTTTLTPETYNPMGISNFLGFTEFCVKEEYKERLVDFTFTATFKEVKRQGTKLTYDANTDETIIASYTEAEWIALDIGVDFVEDVDRSAYAVSFVMEDFAEGEPMFIDEDRVSLYPMTTRKEGNRYTLAGSVNIEYAFSNISGSIVLKP